ncbi:hypothetical protein ACFQQB_55665 [Nonomuraea rubra]|uniref:hypothetical protein n=1 Tax=Nonomuraea rubra TaxID=46180 RepID=UPI00361B6080
MGKALDQDQVMAFLERVMIDSGAAFAGLCTSIGARLGLYEAMAGAGPLTSPGLAARTGLDERYVREWLAAQVAGQYVHYAPGTDTYLLPDEHAAVLADQDAPTYSAGAFTMLQSLYATEDALVDAYRTGEGVGWGSTGRHCTRGWPRSSAPDTRRPWCRSGCPPWTGSWRGWSGACSSPTWAAASATARCSWRGRSRTHAFTASTSTPPLSSGRAVRLRSKGWRIG